MSKYICQFVIFLYFISKSCNNYCNSKKGYKMAIIIKNAESFFEKFENKMEIWAEKLF